MRLTDKKQSENTAADITALALLSQSSVTSALQGVKPSIASIGAASRGEARVRMIQMDRLTTDQRVTLTPGRYVYADRSTQLLVRGA